VNRLSLLVIALAGCSAPAQPAGPLAPEGPAPPAAPAPAADAGPLAAPDAGAGLAVLSAAGDIDGVPGDEQITFSPDGPLRAGRFEIHVDPPESNDYFWHKQSVLRVVTLDAGKRQVAIHLGVPTGDGEDPPNINRVFIVRGGRLAVVFDRIVGVYNPGTILFPGDGTLRYVEQGWEACERAKHPATPVTRQEVVFRLDRAGRTMVEWRRIDTAGRQDCSQLAACPFVYALGDTGAVRVGEILRDLRGARAYSLQSLALPAGTTRVRVAEEKPEVTYLDEVLLEVDGVELRPLACRGWAPPAYCAADHVPFVLRQGDTLDLTFDGPAGAAHTLFARGYYLPGE
jgi:hypothetical protein